MHLVQPVKSCVDEIIRNTGPGLKSMILDNFTTGVIGAGYSKSDLLLREIYLFEDIETIFESSERLNHLKSIVILRPTKDNIERLCSELNRPHYKTYHLYFTNRIGDKTIQKLAEADETEVIRCIREIPLDYQPINPFQFTLRVEKKLFEPKDDCWAPDSFKRTCDGLTSVLFALRINPLIRYQTQSLLCKTVAEHVNENLKNEVRMNKNWRDAANFDISSLLIIVDRRTDMVTPIINKWNYYSMVDEFFHIKNNRIDLSNVPDRRPKDPKQMLISLESDQFFEENYFKNYGEMGPTLKLAVEHLKSTTKSQNKVETVEDMKRFIDDYPETRRYASNIHNHVFLLSELTRLVNETDLISISECEQELVCNIGSSNEVLKRLKRLVTSKAVRPIDSLRLASLFTVHRPDRTSTVNELIKLLKDRKDISAGEIKFVKQLQELSLSRPQNPIDETVQNVTRMIVQGVKGIENILTQYRPDLTRILTDLQNRRLKETEFAFYGERYREEAPKRIIVFYVGGLTYEEALMADQINRAPGNTQVIIGGTTVHNFESFIKEVQCNCF